ncbi:uncharacterized protein EV422DRAFT_419098 [Fimicolochytrium jonesii]|uniref:uncharacterized protein n=1 Tax=Fimicolochytrium jonesii TaxID=1396493 RepID=UPI0022FF16B0|nr:uncharacterized protein EV422DRAFT_419098 [Fimicolochytrium jonesii]KAI8822151.1 hypothetical protein EV422DRAFT_419098 [Fimicolochytrium jonesii]
MRGKGPHKSLNFARSSYLFGILLMIFISIWSASQVSRKSGKSHGLLSLGRKKSISMVVPTHESGDQEPSPTTTTLSDGTVTSGRKPQKRRFRPAAALPAGYTIGTKAVAQHR